MFAAFKPERRAEVELIHAVAGKFPVHQVLGMHELHGGIHVHRGAGEVVVLADADGVGVFELLVEQGIGVGAIAVVGGPERFVAAEAAEWPAGAAAAGPAPRDPSAARCARQCREQKKLPHRLLEGLTVQITYFVFSFKTVMEYGGNSRVKSALSPEAVSVCGTISPGCSREFVSSRLPAASETNSPSGSTFAAPLT